MSKDADKQQTPLGWIFDNGVAAIAILALVIYGVARRGIDGFYGHLNLNAEDVGLNQTVITGRAALAIAGFVVLAAGVAAVVILVVAFTVRVDRADNARLDRHPYRSSDDSRWRVSWGVLIVALVGLPVAGLAFGSYRRAILESGTHIALSAGYWLLVVATAAVFLLRERRLALAAMEAKWRADPRHRYAQITGRDVPYLLWRERGRLPGNEASSEIGSEMKLAIVAVLALGVYGLLALTTTVGWNRAYNVIYGNALNPNWGSLALKADPVCLRWSDAASRPLASDGPYMYLGQNADTLVLYDYLRLDSPGQGRGAPLRIPASGVSLHIATGTDRHWACPAPGELSTPETEFP